MTNKENHIKLEKLERKTPFKTPEGYFESFSERVMDKIEVQTKVKTITIVARIFRPALAIFASFIFIFILIYVPVKILRPGISMNNNDDNQIEILDYYNLNDQTILNTFEEETIDNYDEELLETVLLASVSEMELLDI